jgi:hypothetical protein
MVESAGGGEAIEARGSLARFLALGFAAGFVSVLVFHHGAIWLPHMAGPLANLPFPLRAAPPFGVPQVHSLASWGGVWGVTVAALLGATGLEPDARRVPVGTIGCLLAGFTVVAALRGQPLMGGWDPGRWWRSTVISGAWGLRTGLLLPFRRRRGAG